MVFIVALYVPWCRYLEALPDVQPQLYADNLKCSADRLGAFFDAARFTAQYVRAVGQDVSPGKCVLLSTSRSVRKAMKLWDMSGDGGFWKVQLDVRDLGGHLDFTLRARGCSSGLSFEYGLHRCFVCTLVSSPDVLPDVSSQLYADNLKCSAERSGALFDAARFTAMGMYVRLVKMCLLVNVSFLALPKSVRKAMKLWDVSVGGGFWKVQLDVRDLGGHLDFTGRALAGTLS